MNTRELRINGENFHEVVLVESSTTGRETIMCFGTWDNATVQIQTQIKVDGELSPVTTFPDFGTHIEDFAIELNVGYKSPVIVTVTDAELADLFLKVVAAEM
jgi:hypothetical protein